MSHIYNFSCACVCVCVCVFPQLGLPIRGSNCVPKQPVSRNAGAPPRVPQGLLIWPGSSRIQSLVPQHPNVQNVQNVWQNPKIFFSRSKNPNFLFRAAREVKCPTC